MNFRPNRIASRFGGFERRGLAVCDRCGGPADQPPEWRTHLCDTCMSRWDKERECPDGRPHVLVLRGFADAESGPLEGGPYEIRECERCHTFSIDAPIENVLAAIDLTNAKRDGREES